MYNVYLKMDRGPMVRDAKILYPTREMFDCRDLKRPQAARRFPLQLSRKPQLPMIRPEALLQKRILY
jgi:hypothetical protein